MSLRFTDEPLSVVWAALKATLADRPPGAVVSCEVPDPDDAVAYYDGELTPAGRARPLELWAELAAHLGATLLMPERRRDTVVLRLRKLGTASWHTSDRPGGHPEKYGVDTAFARADKFEQPGFLAAWRDAVAFLALPPDARVVALGCHTGAELGALASVAPRGTLLGVDHSASAIAAAQKRFPGAAFSFQVHDLTQGLPPGPFDLVVAINVLHSPALDGRALFRAAVRALAPGGRLLLGFPNARDIDHRVRLGGRPKHAKGPELSQLLVDVMYHRRYLHQHRFKTLTTGTSTVLLAGRRFEQAGAVTR